MPPSESTFLFRWSLPGWIAIIAFLLCLLVDVIQTRQISLAEDASRLSVEFRDESEISNLVLTVFRQIEQFDADIAIVSALVVALAGLPLGFLIYQFYFFLRWNSPYSGEGFLPPLITGRTEDLEMMTQGLDLAKLENSIEWRREYMSSNSFWSSHKYTWYFVDYLILSALRETDNNSSTLKLAQRRRYLTDIMHTLAAANVALVLGFVAYLALKATVSITRLDEILEGTVILSLMLLTALLVSTDSDPTKVEKRRAWVFWAILVLSIVPLLSSPIIFSASSTEAIVLVIIYAVGLALVYRPPKEYLVSDVGISWMPNLLLGLATIAVASLSYYCINTIAVDRYGVRLDMLIQGWTLLLGNYMLMLNRVNTRNELAALDNFILRDYYANLVKPPEQKHDDRRDTSLLSKLRYLFTKLFR